MPLPVGEVTATVPELFQELMHICANLGIDTSNLPALTSVNAIKEYVQTLGIQLQPIYKEVTTLEQTGWTWIFNSPVNPAETTDIVARTVTDLTVVGGGATAMTSGKKIFGTVSRKIAAGAMIAALGVSTFAAQIGEHISRLVEGLTPWTVDGVDAVPVLIDEDGYTYLDERAVQKFREDLAELGIFDVEPYLELGDNFKIGNTVYNYSSYRNYNWDNMAYVHLPITLSDANNTWEVQNIKVVDINGNNIDISNRTLIYKVRFAESLPTLEAVCIAVDLTDYVSQGLINTGNITYRMGGIKNGGTYTDTVISVSTRLIQEVIQNTTTSESYTKCIGTAPIMTKNNFVTPDPSSFPYVTSYEPCAKLTIVFGSNGGGVPGFVPTNPTVGDLTKSITQLYPDWASNGVSIPSPTDEDLTNTGTWLPVSITETEPFDQDHTATSSDQDGDTTEDTQQSIMDKLQELIQTIAQYQAQTDDEVITPTIPVEDSGDTPPATPTVISGASNGLWTIYNPTLSEVQQFGAWLWSDSIIDQIKRQFASPIDGVIGFMSIYCTPITGDRKMIKTGYLTSPVSAKEVTNQYVTINCGQVAVPEYYHSAIDYTRSKVDIFLPFIGIVPLDCSVVTGSTLEVIYRIDVLTGTCLAQIKVIKQNSDAVMYTYNGNCGVQLPLTAGTYTGLIGTLASLCSGAISAMSGNMIGVGESLLGMAHSMGTNIQKSGVLASNAGALGIRIPYLIITHPTAYDAMIYNQFYGYPSNVYQRLSAMSGFVRVKDIHLDSISCTDQELEMIYAKLKEGVIIS